MGDVIASGERGREARPSVGSSFHYSFGLLPRDQRRGIEAVYSFCRVIDDIADEEPGHLPAGGRGGRTGPAPDAGAASELAFYRQEIDRCYSGWPTIPMTRELKDAIDRFGIPRQPLDDLLDGVEMDLYRTRYSTFNDLRDYCYRVASTIGIICLSIFGCRHPKSRDYAIDLGIALQLTNILRDLKDDALRDRIYVPLEEMAAFGYSEGELLAGVHNPAFLALMQHQARRAERHFERAAAQFPEAERARLLAARVMAAIYRRLLRRIEAVGFRVFDRRIRVPRLQQIGLALKARITGQVRS
ncbi:MAG: presqualene diphosphate synthase HpnD [Acidobacteriota bacterium]